MKTFISSRRRPQSAIRLAALISASLLLALPGFATASPNENGTVFLQNFTVQQMGGASQNFGVVQGRDGLIHVANLRAILQYDGNTWTDIPHRRQARPVSIDRDQDGRIYVGFQGDLGFIERDVRGRAGIISLRSQLPDSLRDVGYIWATLATPEGIVFRSPRRIYRWRPPATGGEGSMEAWSFPSANKLLALARVNGRTLFWQKNVGLMEVAEEGCRPLPGGGLFRRTPVRDITPFSGDTLLLTCEREGLYLFDGQRRWPLPGSANLYTQENFGTGCTALPDGRFALATRFGGLLVFDREGGVDRIVDRSVGLLDDNLLAAPTLDSQGGLWLPLNYGLARVEVLSPVEYFDYELGVEGNISALQRHRGTLYAATSQGIKALMPASSAGRPAHFVDVPGAEDRCWDLEVVDGRLFGVTTRGLEEIQAPDRPPRLIRPMNMAYSIASSPDAGRIFVGTYLDGLHAFRNQGGDWAYETRVEGTSGQVLLIAATAADELWLSAAYRHVERVRLQLGTGGTIEGAKVTVYDTADGLGNLGHYYPLILEGEYYAGNPSGFFRYDPARDRFRPDSTLGDQFGSGQRGMWNMTRDSRGRVWFNSTFAKGARVTPGEQGSYEMNYPLLRVSDATFLCFYPEEGGSVLWAGGENGRIIRYDESFVPADTASYHAIIREVTSRDSLLLAGRRPVGWEPPRLPYEHNSLRFTYTIPRYDAPEFKRYQYRLVGLSEEWSDWTNETYRDFNSLPENYYRFEVRGYDVYYNESDVASFEFVVLPPWYRTWWAYALYVLGGLGLLLALIQWRVHSIEAQRRHLAELVQTRTKELAVAHDKIMKYNERLEQMLDERTRHLVLSERQAVFGQLVQGIVHNLKNPLTTSTASANLIRMTLRKARPLQGLGRDELERQTAQALDKVAEAVEWIDQANLSLNDMITSLLTKSRADREENAKRIDLNELVRTEIEFLQADRRFKSMVDKHIQLSDEPLIVEVVPGELSQVVQNIIRNALDAMHNTLNPWLAVQCYRRAEGEAVVSVADSGPGIPPDIQKKIFDPFFSTKSPQLDQEAEADEPKGTGLGLWMSKQALEGYGGRIEVESEAGSGTTFRIILPLAEEKKTEEKEI